MHTVWLSRFKWAYSDVIDVRFKVRGSATFAPPIPGMDIGAEFTEYIIPNVHRSSNALLPTFQLRCLLAWISVVNALNIQQQPSRPAHRVELSAPPEDTLVRVRVRDSGVSMFADRRR